MMSQLSAMILAGGRGKRMDILCQGRPKPVLPFAGKFRVIDYSLSNCVYSQISQVALLTDYQRSYMADYIKGWNANNGGNLQIREPGNGSYKGTADAVYQNLDYLRKHGGDRVLILAGDHIYRMDYRKMLDFHEKSGADVTVGVLNVPMAQAHRFGTVATGEDGRIMEFVEKSDIPKSNTASMGIYIFNKDVLERRLTEDAAEKASPHDFGYAVLPRIVGRDKVFAYRFDGYWQDIGTIQAYYDANMELIKEPTGLRSNLKSPLLTAERELSSPCMGSKASVTNSVISPGCIIRGRVENSILSPQVWIDEQAEVRNSVIMQGTFIGRQTIIDGCVVDEKVRINDHCYVGYGSQVADECGVTVLGKGVTVPPGIAIGRNCRVAPDSGPSDFTGNVIPKNQIFGKSQPAGGHILAGGVSI
jgi:glucose-1-phosphate adenylyltransferase